MRREALLVLYLASVIIGVGVLELPIAVVRSGLIPLLIALAIMAFVTAKIYDRIVLISREYGYSQYALQKAAIASGLKLSSRISLTLGLFLYALSADVAYVLIATSSILALKDLLNRPLVCVLFICLAAFLRRNVYAFKSTLLIALRSLVIRISNDRLTASLLYLLTLFIAEAYPDRNVQEVPEEAEEILPRHFLGSLYTFFKISVLIAASIAASIVAIERLGIQKDLTLFPERRIDAYYALGIAIFAFVGPGVCNALIYKRYSGKLAKRVNLLAALGVLAVYAFFVLDVSLSVPIVYLKLEDVSYGHAFLAFQRLLEDIGLSSLGALLIALANIFAILTITTAFLGMTDAAAERLYVEGVDYRLSRTSIALIAYVLAFVAHESSLRVTTMLGIAGSLGGGLAMMLLPRLLGKRSRKSFTASFLALLAYFAYSFYSASPAERPMVLAATIAFLVSSSIMIAEALKVKSGRFLAYEADEDWSLLIKMMRCGFSDSMLERLVLYLGYFSSIFLLVTLPLFVYSIYFFPNPLVRTKSPRGRFKAMFTVGLGRTSLVSALVIYFVELMNSTPREGETLIYASIVSIVEASLAGMAFYVAIVIPLREARREAVARAEHLYRKRREHRKYYFEYTQQREEERVFKSRENSSML